MEDIKRAIGKRLKQLRKKIGMSQKEFAEKLNITPSSLNNYEVGRRNIPPEILADLSDKFNVNIDWLLTGNDPMFKDELEIKETETDEIVKLPFYKESFVSAGYGFGNYEDEFITISFSKELLKFLFKVNIERGLHLVPVFGNSMTPTIPEGAVAIVLDYKVEVYLREGSIYVVKYDGEEFIKRVFKDPVSGNLKLISDNEDYPPIEVSGEESNRFQILGRVIGYISGF